MQQVLTRNRLPIPTNMNLIVNAGELRIIHPVRKAKSPPINNLIIQRARTIRVVRQQRLRQPRGHLHRVVSELPTRLQIVRHQTSQRHIRTQHLTAVRLHMLTNYLPTVKLHNLARLLNMIGSTAHDPIQVPVELRELLNTRAGEERPSTVNQRVVHILRRNKHPRSRTDVQHSPQDHRSGRFDIFRQRPKLILISHNRTA